MSWGIIKYAAGSGSFPETDVASFDGWYTDRADAKAIFDDWSKRYPHWIVALVEQHEARWSDAAWERVANAADVARKQVTRDCHEET
jgi:hypothetical protein